MLLERDDVLERLLPRQPGEGAYLRVISAPVGVGKTALLAAAAAEARSRGWLVREAGASRDGQPLGTVATLLDTPVERLDVATAVRELTSGTAAPVLLCVDDLHAVDAQSLEVLRQVAGMPSARTSLIVTERDGETAADPTFVALLVRARRGERLRLRPLSTTAVRAALAELIGERRARDLADACAQASGGNSLLVRALVDDAAAVLRQDGEPGDVPLGSGERFPGTVRTLVDRLPEGHRHVARAVAVLGVTDTSAVASLAELDIAPVRHALGSLRAAGLLGPGGYRHAAVRATVLARIAPAERSTLRLRAARAAYDSGAHPREIAAHLIAAGAAPQAWATDTLLAAADIAEAADDLDFAVAALELAARAGADADVASRTRMRLARVEWRTEPAAAARHLPRLLDGVRAGHLEPVDAATVARWLMTLGRTEEADAVLQQLSGRRDPVAEAELAGARIWFPALFPARDVTAPVATTAPATTRSTCGRPGSSEAEHLLRNVSAGRGADDLLGRTHRVLQAGELAENTVGTMLTAIRALVADERHEEAESWAATLLQQSASRGATTWEALFAAVRGEAALRRGDLPEANRWSTHALSQLSRRSWGVAIGLPYSVSASSLVGMSRLEEATHLMRRPVPDMTFGSRYGLRYLQARGALYLGLDRLDEAGTDFARCGELAQVWECDEPVLEPWRTGYATVLLRSGRHEEVRALVDQQLAWPPAQTPRLRGQMLHLRAATEPLRDRPPVLRDAVELLRAAGDRLELSRALADLSRAHHGLGEHNQARDIARQALDTATACGAQEACLRTLEQPVEAAPPVAAPGAPPAAVRRTTSARRRSSARGEARLAATG